MDRFTRRITTLWGESQKRDDYLAPVSLTAITLLFIAHVFRITGLGEQDTARLVNDAFVWHMTGTLPNEVTFYRATILPLPMILIKNALDLGVPLKQIPALLNEANAVAGPLLLIPLFYLWRRLTDNKTALWGILLTIPIPAFWVANLYGYPHLPALCFGISSLMTFQLYLDAPSDRQWIFSLLAATLLSVATCLKADTILLGGAFFGLVWVVDNKPLSRRHLTAAGILVLAAILPLLLRTLVIPLTGKVSAPHIVSKWQHLFPLSRTTFFSGTNLMTTAYAAGPVFLIAGLIGAGTILTERKGRRLLMVAALWSIPDILFWGMRPGNSARHLLLASIPIGIITAAALRTAFTQKRRQWQAFATLLVTAYFSTGMSASTVAPGSDLFRSAGLIQERIANLMKLGTHFPTTTKKVMVVGGPNNPYVKFNIFSRTVSLRYLGSYGHGPHPEQRWFIAEKNGSSYELSFKYLTSDRDKRVAVEDARKHGFEVVTD